VALGKDACVVTAASRMGRGLLLQASEQMFLDVWNGRHTPVARDFLTGAIKSNNPLLLKEFVAAFRK
jgi:hypothetical protein